MCTTCIWNNRHQVHSKTKKWENRFYWINVTIDVKILWPYQISVFRLCNIHIYLSPTCILQMAMLTICMLCKYHSLEIHKAQNRVSIRVMVFNATFNNIPAISWQWFLLGEETGVPGKKHWPRVVNLTTIRSRQPTKYTIQCTKNIKVTMYLIGKVYWLLDDKSL